MSAAAVAAESRLQLSGLALQCPRCRNAMTEAEPCGGCGFCLAVSDGIVRALPEERTTHYAGFVRSYEHIRAAEGRGSKDSAYYLGLPGKAPGPLAMQWRMRAQTFRKLCRLHLAELKAGARVLDLGAGNGWMSYRLSLLGFQPVAVDLLVNENDGLGAGRFYSGHLPVMFDRVQAELARLPFAPSQFDAAIFNASFHYAEDFAATLGEALRCVKPGGLLLVADTPWYARESSGTRMVREREVEFARRFGTRSNALQSMEFLTPERLRDMERRFDLRWVIHTPWYGLRWALRPCVAALRRLRPPSRFRIYKARKPA